MTIESYQDILPLVFDYCHPNEQSCLGRVCKWSYTHFQQIFKPHLKHVNQAILKQSLPSFLFLIQYPIIEKYAFCIFNMLKSDLWKAYLLLKVPSSLFNSESLSVPSNGVNISVLFYEISDKFANLHKLNIFKQIHIEFKYILLKKDYGKKFMIACLQQSFYLKNLLITCCELEMDHFVLKILKKYNPNSDCLYRALNSDMNEKYIKLIMKHSEAPMNCSHLDKAFYYYRKSDLISHILKYPHFVHFKTEGIIKLVHHWKKGWKFILEMVDMGYSCDIPDDQINSMIQNHEYEICDLFKHPNFKLMNHHVKKSIECKHVYALECISQHPNIDPKNLTQIQSFLKSYS